MSENNSDSSADTDIEEEEYVTTNNSQSQGTPDGCEEDPYRSD